MARCNLKNGPKCIPGDSPPNWLSRSRDLHLEFLILSQNQIPSGTFEANHPVKSRLGIAGTMNIRQILTHATPAHPY